MIVRKGKKNMTRHYNGATIWGTLEKYKLEYTEKRKSYIELYINCPHASYGNVHILGRLWEKELDFESFQARYKKDDEIRLEGNLQQYKGRNEVTRTSFNFYRVQPGPLKEKKAAFRLVGEVVSYADQVLKILVRQKNEGYETKEEVFEVFVPLIASLELQKDPEPGRPIRVKGYIEIEEDEFGDALGPQRPVVKQLELIDEQIEKNIS